MTTPGTRTPSRADSRTPARFVPKEPHEKFDISQENVPEGLIAEWKAYQIMGMSNRDHMVSLFQAGWMPARAADFPNESGYGVDFGQAVMDLGLIKAAGADDPIIKNGQMLMLRPKELVDAAQRHDKAAANNQVDTQIKRLALNSKRAIGKERTKASRSYVDDDE